MLIKSPFTKKYMCCVAKARIIKLYRKISVNFTLQLIHIEVIVSWRKSMFKKKHREFP